MNFQREPGSAVIAGGWRAAVATTDFGLDQGLSGFELREARRGVIEKRSGPAAAARLYRQFEKQRFFTVKHPRFRVCEVLSDGGWAADGGFAFEMPRYHLACAVDYVDHFGATEVRHTWGAIVELVEEFIAASPSLDVPRETFADKASLVSSAIEASPWARMASEAAQGSQREIAGLPPSVPLPVGVCHGDLTLSNVLFAGPTEAHVLIDFLDSYVTSPLLDVAKLRQETLLAWTSLATTRRHDRTKYRLAMRYFDRLLHERFAEGRSWRTALVALERQTLLRVIPYCRSGEMARMIIDAVHAL